MKRDYRLPIAKRSGPTAARTVDTNATEIVSIGALGVSTFRHFSQSTRGRELYFRHRDTLLRVTGRAHCKLGSDTLDICSNFYISSVCARVDVSIYDFERKFSGINADVQLEMCNRITYLIIQ